MACTRLAALAVVVVTTMLARRFVRPIQQLGSQTAAIAQGQFQPVEVGRRNDEIRDLALSINRMTETLGRYEQSVRQNERLRTLGQLGAGMAHQLRNSATGAWMAVELHQRQCPIAAEGQSLEVAIRQLRLMESYLQRFLTLGRPSAGVREPVALEPLVRDVLALVGPAAAHAKIELTWEGCPETLAVLGDVEALRQVLVNLILNAIEAASRHDGSPPKVIVEVRPLVPPPLSADRAGATTNLRSVPGSSSSVEPAARNTAGQASSATHRVAISIKDSGPGPAENIRDKLFQPFVTEKPDGTGLGLFVAREIVEAHNGTIAWQHADGMTCFTLELPLERAHGSPAGS